MQTLIQAHHGLFFLKSDPLSNTKKEDLFLGYQSKKCKLNMIP